MLKYQRKNRSPKTRRLRTNDGEPEVRHERVIDGTHTATGIVPVIEKGTEIGIGIVIVREIAIGIETGIEIALVAMIGASMTVEGGLIHHGAGVTREVVLGMA